MKKITISFLSLFLVSLFTSNLSAGTVGVGVSGSFMNVSADGKETDLANSDTDASVVTKSVDNDVFVGGIYLDYTFGNEFVIGIEGVPGSADVNDGALTRTDTVLSVTDTAATTSTSRAFSANASVEDYFNVYFEYPIGPVYVKAGMSQIDVITNEVKSANGASYGNATLDGFNVGLGYKTLLGPLTTRLAYEFTDYESLSITSSGATTTTSGNGNHKVTGDLDTWAVKFSLGYQF